MSCELKEESEPRGSRHYDEISSHKAQPNDSNLLTFALWEGLEGRAATVEIDIEG